MLVYKVAILYVWMSAGLQWLWYVLVGLWV